MKNQMYFLNSGGIRRMLVTAAVVAGGFLTANAATLTLSDGSRLEGEFVKIHEGKVHFKTGFAGVVEVPQSMVTGLSSAESMVLRTKSGEVFQGAVSTSGGVVSVQSSSGSVQAGLGEVVAGWQPGAKDPITAARESQLEGQLRRWSYTASADISGAIGNSENFGAAMAFEAKLEGPSDRLVLYAGYKYKESENLRSEDEQKAGMRYTNFFSDKMGWFVREELERDVFEGIDFRSTTAGGLTYRFVKEERLSVEGSAGLSYRYESYSDPMQEDDGFPGLDFGLNIDWQFADWGKLVTTLSYIPSVNDFGDFLIEHESGVDIPLGTSEGWVMRFGLANQYNSEPGPGRENLDTTYFTRLILSWK